MKPLLTFLLLIFSFVSLKGQAYIEATEGTISYVTKQNVYVKFQSTQNISAGDTLFIVQEAIKIPVLVVKELSSISCVCATISAKKLSVGDKISTQKKLVQQEKEIEMVTEPAVKPEIAVKYSDTIKKELPVELKQSITGRVALSSYSNFSNVSDFSQRMRYTFSLNAQNISNSKLSGETYISFVHKLNEWPEIKDNIFNGLKIYSLALNYAFNKNNNLWVGRKINPRISNVGAIDGLQYETKFKAITAGVFAGTRPDYMDYSFNANLMQFGGYISHDYATEKGSMQSSIALAEQKNNGNTDRRFVYLQHSNSLFTNLYFFGSIELDLFNKVINTQDSSLSQDNKPNLSNLYVSLRYKFTRQLSVSLSYSARQNIIYYETYKTIVDQLLESATMKGYMLQFSYRPVKYLSLGANAGYRFTKQDPRSTKNLYTYMTYSNVPWLKASATISATLLQTAYMDGNIYSIGVSRDLLPGKLFGGINYRYVKYKFVYTDTPLIQNMGELNLTWRVMKKLSCSLNFEGTLEKGRNYDRIYVNLTQRF